MNAGTNDPLVAGRACGGCTVCCTVLAIETEEIRKPAGVPCRHCAGGCAIHETRPQVCRDYHCAWRSLPIFSDAWRPDLSGVLAELESEDLPPQFGFSTGISLMLVGANPARTLRQSWFIDFVRTGLNGNMPLFLALPGPAGHHAAKLLLNDAENTAAAASNRPGRLKDALEKALKRLQAYSFKPQT
jgi:hypothetical protein